MNQTSAKPAEETGARTIAITGASGLVGSALSAALRAKGHRVIPLVRGASTSSEGAAAGAPVRWDPRRGLLDPKALEGIDAVVHLAGESIAGLRWTADKKRRIRDSRLDGTRALSRSLAELASRPAVLVCASAIGYYGDRGDTLLDESQAPGEDFLAGVCRGWEHAADPAREAGIRVVHLRTGIVLSRRGGALAKMLPPFQLGAGGILGDGRQWMSWIALDDLVRAYEHAIESSTLEGGVNAVAQAPVTNREFTQTLGRVLGRPTILPLPAFAIRLSMGEMGEALLLSSARVVPSKLIADGFSFAHPELEDALRHVLKGKP